MPPAPSTAHAPSTEHRAPSTVVPVLWALTACHLINDLLQSLLPALYPMLKTSFSLDFWQIGMITLTNQVTSSLLQPFVGLYTDKRPRPYSLPVGMGFTLVGLVLLATAQAYAGLLVAAALVGIGSSIFHPESSRIARLASGGRHGFAQSLFQTGGNLGTSLGPLMAAFIVLPRGQGAVGWFTVVALIGIVVLWRIGHWYWTVGIARQRAAKPVSAHGALPRARVRWLLVILLGLVFSKYVYISSFVSYFMFFLIERFGVSTQQAQFHLFAFLGAVAAGTFIGGPVGDRFGRRPVILGSIVGIVPFAIALPYLSLGWTTVLSIVIGLVLSSAFSAILVYAQELVPTRVGLVSGLFFGFAFGVAGTGAAVLGWAADHVGIVTVFRWCSWLPVLGLIALWLPDIRPHRDVR
ncbi:MAG: MFS transporter [Acidimicrobiia bacterium]|nr:MFS transporter [Acidimicrobiia bacterium]